MPICRSPNDARYPRPQPGRDPPEQVVAINRNAWSQSSGARTVISDVDGTLVTSDKKLMAQTVAAVAALRTRGIAFSIISSRPPRAPGSYRRVKAGLEYRHSGRRRRACAPA